MKKFTFLKRVISLISLLLIYLTDVSAQTATIFPINPTVYVGKPFSFNARATGFCGNQRNYTWTATGSTTTTVNSSPDYDVEDRFFTYNTPGTYTITVVINRTGGCGTQTATVSTTVTVLAAAAAPPINMWAGTNGGADVSNYSVANGLYSYGPEFLFDPFPGSGATTAAIARSPYPTPISGYYFWLENTGTNGGSTTIYGCNGNGTGRVTIGSLDLNGGSGADLGFVRFAMDASGVGWILAGDGTTLYLAKFISNGLNPVTPVLEDANGVTLVGGTAATFVNGDLCLDGNGNMYALANNGGGGTTQIFIGQPNGNATTLTKKWDLVDQSNLPFSGTVNGVCFDLLGSMYISTDGNPEAGPNNGLYYINQATVNGAAGTVQASFVHGYSGFTDLGTNVFPTTTLLPVKLGNFSVIKQGANAVINWMTLTETNANHFEIERSTDGINFITVGTTTAAGTTSDSKSYQHTDLLPLFAGIVYYRLKTVDIDTRNSYSKIVPLRINGDVLNNFTVFPNPFTSDLKIQLQSDKEADITIRINNAAGQQVVYRTAFVQKGENIIVLSSELGKLQPGLHMIEIISKNGKMVQKIIKR
jgi:Secretion system C-terminal sorting domain